MPRVMDMEITPEMEEAYWKWRNLQTQLSELRKRMKNAIDNANRRGARPETLRAAYKFIDAQTETLNWLVVETEEAKTAIGKHTRFLGATLNPKKQMPYTRAAIVHLKRHRYDLILELMRQGVDDALIIRECVANGDKREDIEDILPLYHKIVNGELTRGTTSPNETWAWKNIMEERWEG